MNKAEKLAQASNDRAGESLGKNRRVDRPAPAAAVLPPKFAGVTRLMNVASIEVAKIVRDANQPREEFDEESLDRLAQSLRTRGQLQPVRVRWDEGQGVYVMIAGERRWRAAERAGLPTIAAVIHEGELSRPELLAAQLVENCLREDLRPIEQARAYRTLMDANGWTTRQLAEELSIAQPTISQALALLTLPEPIQAQVDSGALPAATAYEVSRIKDPGEQAAVAEEAIAGKITRDGTRERRTQGTSRLHRKFKSGNLTVTVTGPSDPGLWAVAAALHDVAHQADEAARAAS